MKSLSICTYSYSSKLCINIQLYPQNCIFSVNRFLRSIGSKQPGPEVALLSGVDCTSTRTNLMVKL